MESFLRRMPTAGPIKLDSSVGLLVSNGLLKEQETRDRKAVGEACLEALQQWAEGHGARTMGQG